MIFAPLLLLCFGLLLTAAGKIKHIVVVMEENRSFDHMLGWRSGSNGVTGEEFNLVDPSNPSSKRVYVTKNAVQCPVADPSHSVGPTTNKIFTKAKVAAGDLSVASMGGFVESENHARTNYNQIMDLHTAESVPILNALADDFVLMDRFFASVPGPTWPNRMFALSATSAGSTATGEWYHNRPGTLFPQETFFDQVTAANLTWKNYYNDTPWELFMETVAHNPKNTAPVEEFWRDCEAGALPSFSWINPRSGINVTTGVGSNDQHPDHDVAAGEAFYKDVYEALRSSPSWNETLLIITYDEHGGYWDHVPTPLDVPPPGDNETSYPDKFAFDRLGVRIPTVLISPWLAKGYVQSAPPAAQKPAGNSEYDLTSIMATARKLLGMEDTPLTDRDAWAGTFEHLFDALDTPRKDCPMHLPDPIPPQKAALEAEAERELNDLQRHIMTLHAHHARVEYPHHITAQKDVSEWLQGAYATHRGDKDSASGAISAAASYAVVVDIKKGGTGGWKVNSANGTEVQTVSVPVGSATYCLDAGRMVAGEAVTVSPCDGPQGRHYQRQSWVWGGDATFRVYHNQSLCLDQVEDAEAGDVVEKTQTVLKVCDGDAVTQHYAFHGKAPGSPYSGYIFWGDDLNALQVQK